MQKLLSFIFFAISVGLLYGVYFMYIEPRLQTGDQYTAKQSPELEAFMREITIQLNENTQTVFNSIVIERAEKEWQKDPFYDMIAHGDLASSSRSVAKNYVAQRTDFEYTGYLSVAGREIAIVNDMEYEKGETIELDMGMFVLESIFPSKVVIVNRANRAFLEVPLKELLME